jgi:AmmeMemoRadiSam system protein B/AmmeMemoRadiSam system protein A
MTATELPDTGAAWVRPPAVAGSFYPASRDELRTLVQSQLAAAAAPDGDEAPPEAIVAPHAGLRYSGPTAAVAYRAVAPRREQLRRVVIVGPAHRVPVGGVGIGTSTAVAWHTPLGDVPLDTTAAAELVAAGLAVEADDAHAPEHSIEVHLPYVQAALGPVAVVPLVVGGASPEDVARAIEALWASPETLVVASSDLSHYLDEASARARDDRTSLAVVEERTEDIGPEDACGYLPIRGLLIAARRRGLVPRRLAGSTSAAATGDTARVVGYGAFGLGPPLPLDDGDRRWLTALARRAIEHELGTGDFYPLADEDVPERVRGPRASFVTLERGDELLGCIGSLEPRRPLWQDVARNARAAAFDDPRFGRLTPDELGEARVEISVLSPLVEIPAEQRQDVERVVRPGVDGVLLAAGTHRGTFLPAVWAKLPEPSRFVSQLVRKAGLDDDWPAGARAWRYTTDEFTDA